MRQQPQNGAYFLAFFSQGLTVFFSRMLENLIAGSLGEVNKSEIKAVL